MRGKLFIAVFVLVAAVAVVTAAGAGKVGNGSSTGSGSVFLSNPVQSLGDESLTDQKDSEWIADVLQHEQRLALVLGAHLIDRLLEQGIYMTPSNGLHWIISTAHTERDVAALIEATDRACTDLA